MFSPSLFPFSNLSNADLLHTFISCQYNLNNIDHDLKKILTDSLSDEISDTLEFHYYTPLQLSNLANKYKTSSQLSIFHVNVRSLNANYNKLVSFLQCLSFDFDVLILSEIWSTNITYYVNLFNNYNFFFDLPDNKAGGVGIYVKKSLNATETTNFKSVQPNLKPRCYESVWVEIPTKKGTTIIGGFYRHPNTSVKDFSSDFLDSLDKLKNVKHCYVMGDLNICLSNYSCNPTTRAFIDTILDTKFLPYVFLPTRFTNHSSTIIDHVYSNDLFTDNRICKTGLIINDIADHCANFMFIIDNNIKPKITASQQKARIFSKGNTANFNSCLATEDWSRVYNCSDPNSSLNCFIDKITCIHDQCFPLVPLKNKSHPDKKWITPALIKSINVKCKLYKKWIKSKKPRDELRYKNYAKVLRNILYAAEKQYYAQLFDSKVHDSKAIWRHINSLVNNKSNKCADISHIVLNGASINKSPLIANSFNNYFCEVSDRLSLSIPSRTVHSTKFEDYLGPPNYNSFYCSNITINELIAIVKNLKPSRSCISNCISSSLLKDCIEHVALPLLHICNLSFDLGIFPDQLKISRVIPVFKKGNRVLVSNYRPISITNPIAKVLERLFHTRMISYLEKFKILYDYQFGFRKKHSTSIAVIDIVNLIQNELFRGNYVLGIFMDLQKAFDTVNPQILLKKLEHYGFRGICLDWLKSYITGRTQFTVVNGCSSEIKTISCGIPQGTVLGPLLFILYINDIANSVNNSHIKLFADDSNLFVISNNLNNLFITANNELSHLSQWVYANKLYINYEKTTFMLFEPRKKLNIPHDPNFKFTLFLDGHAIERVQVTKFLGIYIEEDLSWSEHINFLVNKISSLSGILGRNKAFLSLKCKKDIYFALIHSQLTYCIEIYANVTKLALKPLIIKCNRLLRLLQSKPRSTPLSDLYSTFNTLPIDLLFEFHTAKFIHKCMFSSHLVPLTVRNWFQRGSSVHAHDTRHSERFVIQSDCNSKSIRFYGPSMWAKLPLHLQNDASLTSFLRGFKNFLLNNLKIKN